MTTPNDVWFHNQPTRSEWAETLGAGGNAFQKGLSTVFSPAAQATSYGLEAPIRLGKHVYESAAKWAHGPVHRVPLRGITSAEHTAAVLKAHEAAVDKNARHYNNLGAHEVKRSSDIKRADIERVGQPKSSMKSLPKTSQPLVRSEKRNPVEQRILPTTITDHMPPKQSKRRSSVKRSSSAKTSRTKGKARGKSSGSDLTAAPVAIGGGAPKFSFGTRSGKHRGYNSLVVSGTDYINSAALTTANNIQGGSVFSMALNPTTISNTRLSVQVQLYERFMFKKFKIYYVPAVSSATAGGLLGYFDLDTNDNVPVPGAAALRYAAAHQSSGPSNVWTPHVWSLPPPPPNQDQYFCQPSTSDYRLTEQAIFQLLCSVPGAAGTLGSLYCEYEVVLYVEQFDAGSAGSGLSLINSSTATATDIFNTATITGNVGLSVATTTSVVLLNSGVRVLVSCLLNGTGLAALTETLSGCTASVGVNIINSGATVASYCRILTATAGSTSMSFRLTTTGTITSSVCFVANYPTGGLTLGERKEATLSSIVAAERKLKQLRDDFETFRPGDPAACAIARSCESKGGETKEIRLDVSPVADQFGMGLATTRPSDPPAKTSSSEVPAGYVLIRKPP